MISDADRAYAAKISRLLKVPVEITELENGDILYTPTEDVRGEYDPNAQAESRQGEPK